jgi:hypothetical protein
VMWGGAPTGATNRRRRGPHSPVGGGLYLRSAEIPKRGVDRPVAWPAHARLHVAFPSIADAGVTLSSGRPGANAVTIGHALYVIGGYNGGVSLGSIERANIRSDGGLDPFSDAGVALVNPRHFFGSGIFGTYLYVFGGHHDIAGGVDLVTVERASMDVSSGLSDFVDSGVSLGSGKGRWNAAAVVLGNWLYMIGGTRNNAAINSVDRSPIAPDGTLGVFAPAPNGNLMTARAGAGLAVIGGTLYVLGVSVRNRPS